ncbi:MAG TPA: hypothetical protein ENH34_04985 [Phycisphaerales bacterium]|nr:hypothetical protein [Phycisphaerales bacterium]
MLNSYLRQIKNALSSYEWVQSVEFLRLDLSETDLETILLYRVRIMLPEHCLLHAFERLTESRDSGNLKRTKYHFHWQDHDRQLIRRWDNAPHHPEIKTFPDHVHVGQQDTCRASDQHSLLDILEELDSYYCREREGLS